MVKINFKHGNHGYYSFTQHDHAGEPLVCAACSALGMTLVSALRNMNASFVNCEYRSGHIELEIMPFSNSRKQSYIDHVFQTIYIGLKQVELSYPDEVNVVLD